MLMFAALQVIGTEETMTLVFVREGLIMVAKDEKTKVVDESSVYTVCRREFGDDCGEVMVTRMSPARNWESFRMLFSVVPEIDSLCTIFDMPIQRPVPRYKNVLRDYRALRRHLIAHDAVIWTRSFSQGSVAEPIMLSDFIQIRMTLCEFTNNPDFDNYQLVLEIPEDA